MIRHALALSCLVACSTALADAPLLPGQLQRVAKRAALGLGRMGS